MDLIEQAVFTSAETDRQAGYQVVAASPGVADADLRELGIWGPSHDALCDPSPHAVSLNFHPLPSGAFCVGRTVPAGWEYSGRGGRRVYTQCLIVPPPLLTRFANNPFAVLRAATAAGAMRLYQQVPSRLEPVRLAGRAAAVNEALLERLASFPGPAWMAALVQAALGSKRVGVAGGPPGEQVLAGLLNCLPPPWRTQFPFCTGLRISPRRPFRLMALDGGPDDLRRIERLHGMTVLDLSGPPPAGLVPADGWARAIHRVMEMIRREAARYGVSVRGSEIVGLVPQAALVEAAKFYLQLDGFSLDQVLENRLMEFGLDPQR